MKYRKIILAGGNGYLGQILADYYKDKTDQIVVLSRKVAKVDDNIRIVPWDGKTEGEWCKELEDADLLINLCGKNVNCRYTDKNKEEILNSRIIPTRLLGSVVKKMVNPPKVWINITSATIYRHAEDRPQNEKKGDIGYGFSVEVCKKWEECFFASQTPQTRKIALRLGIVLGRSDSAFPRLLNLVKLGLGGKQGDGKQYVSWVHEQDSARCTEWIMLNKQVQGVINCTSPEPVKNAVLMHIIRDAYGIPFGLPSPAWLLKLGAMLIGTETELILKSRWVLPSRLIESGYRFQFTKAEHAIKDILSLRV